MSRFQCILDLKNDVSDAENGSPLSNCKSPFIHFRAVIGVHAKNFKGNMSHVVIVLTPICCTSAITIVGLFHNGRLYCRGRKVAIAHSPPLNFSLSNFFLEKVQNLGLKIPHFKGKFSVKVKMLSIRISSAGNLQLSVGKMQLPALPELLQPTTPLHASHCWPSSP